MRCFLFLAIFIGTYNLGAQTTFIVDDFSDRYFGKVFIADTNAVFSKGWIAIFDKMTKKQLIKISSDELTYTTRDGNLASNIKELPYGEQSSIMYEDFNFDDKKDLALMDGQNSCYHGPSFQIYLAAGNGFKRSPAFTRLAREYCGMFDVDHKKKQISTMTKSGCCWHQYSDFIVENNKPIAKKIIEEGLNVNGITWDIIERIRVRGRMLTKEYSLLNVNDLNEKILYSFRFSNKKRMWLIDLGNTLTYVFTDKDEKVELLYVGPFTFLKEENALVFNNGKTSYKIFQDTIAVMSPTINLQMKGDTATLLGDFSRLQNTSFENVTYH